MFHPLNPQSEELIYGSPEAPELLLLDLKESVTKQSEVLGREIGDDDRDH
jgi:hypothetical protein